MIHVVFNEADIDVPNQAMALDDSLSGEVMLIRDDYAVGPLDNIYLGEGIEARRHWWRMFWKEAIMKVQLDDPEKDDYKTAASLVGRLRRDENEIIWIWAAQNKHDVCGYYWILHYMKGNSRKGVHPVPEQPAVHQ